MKRWRRCHSFSMQLDGGGILSRRSDRRCSCMWKPLSQGGENKNLLHYGEICSAPSLPVWKSLYLEGSQLLQSSPDSPRGTIVDPVLTIDLTRRRTAATVLTIDSPRGVSSVFGPVHFRHVASHAWHFPWLSWYSPACKTQRQHFTFMLL